MKITLFAVRHGDKVYEFREPMEIDIYPKFGRGKALVCPRIGFMWGSTTYKQLFKHLGIQIDSAYKAGFYPCINNFITVREIV